jgi:hypothetical protein
MGTKNSILFRVGAREESFVAMMGRLLTAVRSSCGCTCTLVFGKRGGGLESLRGYCESRSKTVRGKVR